MAEKIKVGLIGIGGMGRTHFECYRNNPNAQIVALCDVDERKRTGDWGKLELNIKADESEHVDLTGVRAYENYTDLIADPEVRLVDICLPTSLHAPVAIAALSSGKDVFCEKPMAFNDSECEAVERVVAESGKQIMIGHCLRYWPQYVAAHQVMTSGEHGKVLYARFHRSSGTPTWGWDDWLRDPSRSGGVVLDMHVHDVDTALWWFGEPEQVIADGVIDGRGLPIIVDTTWSYSDGPQVYLHGAWDNNGGGFRYAFKVVMEGATIAFDSAASPDMQLICEGKAETIPVKEESAYQKEIDDYLEHLVQGRRMERVTPQSSRLAVRVVREEMHQIFEKSGTPAG